jgi:acyl carrier protein
MQRIENRLHDLMSKILPSPIAFSELVPSAKLVDLGFDSLAMISLFVDLEQEFSVSLEQMRGHLHSRCSFGSLLALCTAAQS